MTDLHKIFPSGLRERMTKISLIADGYTEVRLRCNGPVMLQKGREEYFLHTAAGLTKNREEAYIISVNEIREMMEYISNFSVYAYEDEMRQGFLTIQGGHRVGICGKAVMSEEKIKTIRNISFLNIRLAREIKGCAAKLLPYLFENGRLCHTLIISPPGCGKTTLLRDLIRAISEGIEIAETSGGDSVKETMNNNAIGNTARNTIGNTTRNTMGNTVRNTIENTVENTMKIAGRKVGLVDERSEIAACYNGIPQNDLGIRTDVLDGCPKTLGIELMLRSMSPEVIAVDELGGAEDAAMIKRSIYCGCTILATAHGEDRKEWFFHGGMEKRIGEAIFDRYVFLHKGETPGQIREICAGDGSLIEGFA